MALINHRRNLLAITVCAKRCPVSRVGVWHCILQNASCVSDNDMLSEAHALVKK